MIPLMLFLFILASPVAVANYYFDTYSGVNSEVEQVLGQCERAWGSIESLCGQPISVDDGPQMYDHVLDEIVKLIRAMSNINAGVRRHEIQLSLEVLEHLHELIEKMRFEVHTYSREVNSLLQRNDRLIPLLFDLLDRDFAHVYYHYE